ncbi:hypothetical protein J6590_063246 [Homalodisca vitripennis]|nr:hypothetical protein J6590_063246 [Homalodisca vitripennis]
MAMTNPCCSQVIRGNEGRSRDGRHVVNQLIVWTTTMPQSAVRHGSEVHGYWTPHSITAITNSPDHYAGKPCSLRLRISVLEYWLARSILEYSFDVVSYSLTPKPCNLERVTHCSAAAKKIYSKQKGDRDARVRPGQGQAVLVGQGGGPGGHGNDLNTELRNNPRPYRSPIAHRAEVRPDQRLSGDRLDSLFDLLDKRVCVDLYFYLD